MSAPAAALVSDLARASGAPLVSTPAALDAAIAACRAAPCVAVDTEFVWERTYYPRLGLVQLGLPDGHTFLLDAPALDLAPLGALLEDAHVTKVLHDAGQDLAILHRATGAVPKNVFDTRLAAGLCGLGGSLSLQKLLLATLGVHLAKTESRTDWLQRPLTEAQTAYARDDVRYLCAARDVLAERLARTARRAWLDEEQAGLEDAAEYQTRTPEDSLARVKGQGRLHARERAVLKELAAWREAYAMSADLPRGHVVSDDVLVVVAQRKPQEAAQAERFGVPRRHSAAVAEAVRAGLAAPPLRLPETPREDDTLGARVDLLLAYVKGRGLGEGVDPALVASRADVTALAVRRSSNDGAALLHGWRRAFVGDDLLRLLAGDVAIRLDPATGLPTSA